ncbi:MAG: hypothetical protein ACRCY8_05235 [Dermatophilaceae bacterium]
MSWLAAWLVGLGVADLVRATAPRAIWAAPAAGCGAVLAAALLAGLTAPVDLVVLLAALVPLLGWLRLSDQALATGSGHAGALGCLAAAAAWLVGLSGWAGDAAGVFGRWLSWADLPVLDTATPEQVLLVAGLLLTNVATANVLVRVVLVGVGALRPVQHAHLGPRDEPAEQLKGGRLLGPMERLLILGLGLAGQLTAAGLVIAAKGLIRFPELQAKRDDTTAVEGVGIDEVTEYFLVGSFVSWLVALGSLALTR